MTITLTLENGEIIETRTEIIKHNPQEYLASLNAQRLDTIAGRDTYLEDVNARVDEFDEKITTIQNLLK